MKQLLRRIQRLEAQAIPGDDLPVIVYTGGKDCGECTDAAPCPVHRWAQIAGFGANLEAVRAELTAKGYTVDA